MRYKSADTVYEVHEFNLGAFLIPVIDGELVPGDVRFVSDLDGLTPVEGYYIDKNDTLYCLEDGEFLSVFYDFVAPFNINDYEPFPRESLIQLGTFWKHLSYGVVYRLVSEYKFQTRQGDIISCSRDEIFELFRPARYMEIPFQIGDVFYSDDGALVIVFVDDSKVHYFHRDAIHKAGRYWFAQYTQELQW